MLQANMWLLGLPGRVIPEGIVFSRMLRTTSFEGLQLLDKADSTWAAWFLGNTKIYKAFGNLGDGFDGMDLMPLSVFLRNMSRDLKRYKNKDIFISFVLLRIIPLNNGIVTSLHRLHQLCRCCLHGHPAGPPIHNSAFICIPICFNRMATCGLSAFLHFPTRCLHPRCHCHPFSSS